MSNVKSNNAIEIVNRVRINKTNIDNSNTKVNDFTSNIKNSQESKVEINSMFERVHQKIGNKKFSTLPREYAKEELEKLTKIRDAYIKDFDTETRIKMAVLHDALTVNPKTQHKCAEYVNNSLRFVGFEIPKKDAENMHTEGILKQIGFVEISAIDKKDKNKLFTAEEYLKNPKLRKEGDIIVIESYYGHSFDKEDKNKEHPIPKYRKFGHIAIITADSRFLSDFEHGQNVYTDGYKESYDKNFDYNNGIKESDNYKNRSVNQIVHIYRHPDLMEQEQNLDEKQKTDNQMSNEQIKKTKNKSIKELQEETSQILGDLSKQYEISNTESTINKIETKNNDIKVNNKQR